MAVMNDTTVADAISKADHYIALGQTSIYLYRDDPSFPWGLVTKVEAGGSYRLSGPSSVSLTAEHPSGLSFRMSVDFEGPEANGKGVSLFDRDKLRALAMKLRPEARQKFAAFLEREVLSGLQKRTSEIREALNAQMDSEDCVRGLIAFASDASTLTLHEGSGE